jgi:ferrochelatase
MPSAHYQALLVVAFGGPEGPDDVIPFLENVLRGRNVPRERMLAVAEHYQRFGGVSPLNDQNRALIAALEQEFHDCGIQLPIYWGNRNWHPLLADTLREMRDAGIGRALGLFTSAYSSYSSCRQYRENIAQAQAEAGPNAPQIDKLRAYFNHPGFIEPTVERAAEALAEIPTASRGAARLVFTAHSIPREMADGCRYEAQLQEASGLVADALGILHGRWAVVYQSRSGPPMQPWLEPDINDHLRQLKAEGAANVVVVPIGFLSDHMEVVYDLDIEARETARALGLKLVRAKTIGTHPRFVRMIRELVVERITGAIDRPALGTMGASHDVCPSDCCPSGRAAR